MLLRFALWPFLVFLVLECGAGFAISRALSLKGGSATASRLRSGFLISLGATVLYLAVVWASFAGTVRR